MKGICLLLAVAVATAQLWDDRARWTSMNPPPATNAPGSYIDARSAVIGGSIFMTANSQIGTNPAGLFEFNTYAAAFVGTVRNSLPVAYTGSDLEALDGVLFSFGGMNDSFTNNAYFNAPSAGASDWHPAQLANPPPPRNGHSMTRVGSKVIVFGGWGATQYYRDTYFLDTTTLGTTTASWTSVISTNQPQPRNSHTTVSYAGHMYLFGGFFHDVQYVNSPCTNPQHGCVWYNDVWVFSTAHNSWQQATTSGVAPAARSRHSAAVLGKFMFIHGGQVRTSQTSWIVGSDTYVLNLETLRWSAIVAAGDTPTPRMNHISEAVSDRLFIFGGSDGNNQVSTILVLNPPRESDAEVEEIPQPAPEVEVKGLETAVGFNMFFTIAIILVLGWVWRKGGAGGGIASSEYAEI